MRTAVKGGSGRVAEIRRGLLAGIPAARVELHCPHGMSRAFVLTGRDERRNRNAIELALQRQLDAIRCGCEAAAARLS